MSSIVLQELLKMIEGTVVEIKNPFGSGPMAFMKDTVSIDTTNILFIVSGAFTGLENMVKHRTQERVRKNYYQRADPNLLESSIVIGLTNTNW